MTREQKANEISHYIGVLSSQVRTLSASGAVVDAARLLPEAFANFEVELPEPVRGAALETYYRDEFGQTYSELNNGASAASQSRLRQLSSNSQALQSAYIATNPHPLGRKNELLSAGPTSYDQLHEGLHPQLNTYLKEFGYYDIFIVEPEQGHIVYSVYKELDFTTSFIRYLSNR